MLPNICLPGRHCAIISIRLFLASISKILSLFQALQFFGFLLLELEELCSQLIKLLLALGRSHLPGSLVQQKHLLLCCLIKHMSLWLQVLRHWLPCPFQVPFLLPSCLAASPPVHVSVRVSGAPLPVAFFFRLLALSRPFPMPWVALCRPCCRSS